MSVRTPEELDRAIAMLEYLSSTSPPPGLEGYVGVGKALMNALKWARGESGEGFDDMLAGMELARARYAKARKAEQSRADQA